MAMTNHVQSPGIAFAVTLCVVLAAAQGVAQQAPTSGSDRGAPHIEGGIRGDKAIKSERNIGGIDPRGDRGNANRFPASDAGHPGASARDGSAIDAGRPGAGPASAPGIAPPGPDVGANTDLGPVRLEGLAGLQRRANRRALIANTPKMPGPPGIGAPFTRFGASGGTARNAASVMPGAPGAMPGAPSLGRNAPDLRTSATMGGASAVGTASAGVTGAGAALRRQNLPSNATTGGLPHAAVINGTTVNHIASGPGYLGGPAKDRSGINGTTIRPKY